MQNALEKVLGQHLPRPVEATIEKLLLLDRLKELSSKAEQSAGGAAYCQWLLESLRVRLVASSDDLARIPTDGPVVAVANHPFGLIEGCLLDALLSPVRRDFRIMTNYLLASFEPLRDRCVFVDPFGDVTSARANQRGMRQSLEWLKQGGMLAVFPAGEVSHLNLKYGGIADPEWSRTIARIIRISGASVLPLYFKGANSMVFQILGLVHARVRTALLPHEFFNKQDHEIEVRIGTPIGAKTIDGYQDDDALIRYLRHRTYLLQDRYSGTAPARPQLLPIRMAEPKTVIVPPVPADSIAREIAQLNPEQTLVENGKLAVILAKATEIPNALREIGRLRETTFRLAGEGTGREIDLDRFDDDYLHLFVWNREKLEIAGAYRLGRTDEILRRRGIKGLYTNTLFAYKQEFLNRISPALEMGRSFVRLEYQKSFAALLLLWKGIGKFVSENPQYKVLFGPVSISKDYKPATRDLIVTYLKTYRRADDLARLVRARAPFRSNPLKRMPRELVAVTLPDLEELSKIVADIEAGQKGVPILLKQYLKLGGKLAAFNVDRAFGNALDGLIVVDLLQTDARSLERYMGKDALKTFSDYWGRQARPA
jgi:putative hemolysin